jgi:predicted nucleic acid-binding protein
MKVFIDTNVILDRVLFRDEPNFSSAKIFEASATGKIDGYIAALSFSHIAYILRKRFSLDEIREMYICLCTIFNVVGLSKSNIIAASRNRDFTDFEDCLQYECAKNIRADYIVTNNSKDFTKSGINVLRPDEFIKMMLM